MSRSFSLLPRSYYGNRFIQERINLFMLLLAYQINQVEQKMTFKMLVLF